MPDKDGRIVPAFFRAEWWDRVFGKSDCQGPEGDCSCNEVEISWEPEWDLDGAVFTPECECKDRCADPKRDDCKNPKD